MSEPRLLLRGPWRVDASLTDHCDHPVIVDADGRHVADTSQDDGLEGGHRARLAAAAPELLNALEMVTFYDLDSQEREEIRALISRVRNA